MNKTAMLAMLCLALPAAAAPRHPAQHRTRKPATSAPETFRVAAISLTDDDGTTFTLKDAKGVRLDPIKVPVSICRKDHLGRLLPGMDVQLAATTRIVGGRAVRTVDPTRFRAWCS